MFEECNATELYQLCGRAGIPVSPSVSREAMARLLEGLEDPAEPEHPVDRYRLALIGFVTEHWQKIQTQITCPMRELETNPRPCFGCLDTQVMACVITNHDNESGILKHLPPPKDTK